MGREFLQGFGGETSRKEQQGIDEIILLKCVFRKQWECVDWIDLAQDGYVTGSCEHGYDPSHFIKCREFFD